MRVLSDLQLAARRCHTMGSVKRVFGPDLPNWATLTIKGGQALKADLLVALVRGEASCSTRFVAVDVPMGEATTVPATIYEGLGRVLLLGGNAEARIYSGSSCNTLAPGDQEPDVLTGKELLVYGFVMLLFLK